MSESTFLYNQKYIRQMQEISKPLELFSINSFSYCKVYKNGQYTVLNSNLDCSKNRLLNIDTSYVFFKETLHVSKVCGDTYHLILWPEEPKSDDMEICLKHNLWNGLSIIKCNEDNFEFWAFTTTKENNLIQNFYRKNYQTLLGYVSYFNNEMQSILEEGNNYLTVFKKGFNFEFQIEENEFEQEKKKLQTFLNHISAKGIKVKSRNGLIKLTPAEISCLQLVAQNNSAKEIARKLNISRRTVEKHIDNIKNKSGYRLVSDITSLFHDQVKNLVN